MFRLFQEFYRKPQVSDSTRDERSKTYERDLSDLAAQLRQEKSDGHLSPYQHITTTAHKVA